LLRAGRYSSQTNDRSQDEMNKFTFISSSHNRLTNPPL
jgi:hypothetical protein